MNNTPKEMQNSEFKITLFLFQDLNSQMTDPHLNNLIDLIFSMYSDNISN